MLTEISTTRADAIEAAGPAQPQGGSSDWFRHFFIWSSMIILVLTAIFKIWTVARGRDFLRAPAPLLSYFSWRDLLLMTSGVEILACYMAFRSRKGIPGVWWILWFASILLCFKVGVWATGYNGPCSCLGYFGDLLHLSPNTSNRLSWYLLIYFIVGGMVCQGIALQRNHWRKCLVIGWLIAPPGLNAATTEWDTFQIRGYQETIVRGALGKSLEQTNSFEVSRRGPDWRIETDWQTPFSVRSTIACVAGRGYSMTLDRTSGNAETAGMLEPNPFALLDATTESERMLFAAFLTTASLISNRQIQMFPIPFCPPRFPAAAHYEWNIEYLRQPPMFASQIGFTSLTKRADQLPDSSLLYYERHKGLAHREVLGDIDRFLTVEVPTAVYTVTSFTNLQEAAFPLHAKLTHKLSSSATAAEREFSIHVTSVSLAKQPKNLRPTLLPESWIQHVLDGTTYIYQTHTGEWLQDTEARRIGMPAHPALHLNSPKPPLSRLAKALLITLLLLPALLGVWLHRDKINRVRVR